MLLTLILILLLIGAAVVGSIYSSFLVFYNNFNESENYNKAYYAAISALERAELVIRQRNPGYEGSGGRIEGISKNENKNPSDTIMDENFSYFSKDSSDKTSMFRSISSLTNRIPAEGKGNVDWIMAANDSSDYNMMDYEDAEIFLLYKDKNATESDYNPYIKSTISSINPYKIIGKIRLPGKLTFLGLLDTENTPNSNSIKNDAIVDWQIRGNYEGDSFTVFASQQTVPSTPSTPLLKGDSAIRETEINNGNEKNIIFGNNKTPIGEFVSGPKYRNTNSNPDLLTVVSKREDDLSNKTFTQIFDKSTGSQLRLSLLSLLKTKQNMTQTGHIYPFLEYYFEFKDDADNGVNVPDKYYTINSEGQFGDYQVKIVIQKPTIKESILGSFTVIF